jgi:hypothetical protein
MSESENQQIINQVRAEYKAGLGYRHQREAAWKQAEDQYFNKQVKGIVRLTVKRYFSSILMHTSLMRSSVSLYHRHRFPAEIISHCV